MLSHLRDKIQSLTAEQVTENEGLVSSWASITIILAESHWGRCKSKVWDSQEGGGGYTANQGSHHDVQ